MARTHTSRSCDTGRISEYTRKCAECRWQDTLLPRSTLRNWFAGFLYIFNLLARHSQTTTTIWLEYRWYRLIPRPRQKQHNDQPYLHNNSNRKRKREKENMAISVRNPRTGCKRRQPPRCQNLRVKYSTGSKKTKPSIEPLPFGPVSYY